MDNKVNILLKYGSTNKDNKDIFTLQDVSDKVLIFVL